MAKIGKITAPYIWCENLRFPDETGIDKSLRGRRVYVNFQGWNSKTRTYDSISVGDNGVARELTESTREWVERNLGVMKNEDMYM
tara:strand:+ start:2636 stop:2890 length:255 start_codon:yes stop_codon:yes gene_type:complete